MGVLDKLSDYFPEYPSTGKKHKPMQVFISSESYISKFCSFLLLNMICIFLLQTVEIKVKMDCDGCERRVRNSVAYMKGLYFSFSCSIVTIAYFKLSGFFLT